MSQQLPRLDRDALRRKDLDHLEQRLGRPETLVVPVWREQLLVRDDRLLYPRLRDARDLLDSSGELAYLGTYGGEAAFGIDISQLSDPLSHPALAGATALTDARGVFTQLPEGEADLGLYARALLFWHARHRYCGRCGLETRPRDGGHTRRCTSSDCGLVQFPRTDPCVLVLVHDGEQCLLGRQKGWPKGMYSALAGFVEPCESLEEAATRETLEEAGIRIGNLRYASSQTWPFPASLMVGFIAEPLSREIVRSDDELEDARWFSRAQLLEPTEPGFFTPRAYSLAGRMIAEFLAIPAHTQH